ncbi:hypothetical protein IWX50DRAFT_615567 [Phyllosticta citricarpa]
MNRRLLAAAAAQERIPPLDVSAVDVNNLAATNPTAPVSTALPANLRPCQCPLHEAGRSERLPKSCYHPAERGRRLFGRSFALGESSSNWLAGWLAGARVRLTAVVFVPAKVRQPGRSTITTYILHWVGDSQVLRGPSGRHQSKCSSTRVGKRITDRQTRWLSWLGPLVCPTTRYTTRFTQHPTSSIQHQTNRHTAPTNREANSLCSATSMYDAPFPRPCRQIDKRCQPACLPTRLHHHAPCTPSTRARRRKERETEKKRGSASLHPQPHTRNAMQASKLLVLQARFFECIARTPWVPVWLSLQQRAAEAGDEIETETVKM